MAFKKLEVFTQKAGRLYYPETGVLQMRRSRQPNTKNNLFGRSVFANNKLEKAVQSYVIHFKYNVHILNPESP